MDKIILEAVTDYLGGEFYDFPNGYVLLAETDGMSEREVEEQFSLMFDVILRKNPIFYRIARSSAERERLILARKANLPALSRIRPTTCVEDCTIKITNFAEIIKKIEAIPENIGAKNMIVATICHMEGNLHPTFLFNENNPDDVRDFERAMDHLYKEIILPAGGTLTGEHGIGKVKTPYLKFEHGNDVVYLMNQIKDLFDPKHVLNPGIGKGDPRITVKSRRLRSLKEAPGKILELRCMRCGFCLSCPSRTYHGIEAYSPRGRLTLLNGIVHGEVKITRKVLDILNTCTLCGLCSVKCPAGVRTYEIFEKAREIIHSRQYHENQI